MWSWRSLLLSLGVGVGVVLIVVAPRVADACDYAPGIWGSAPEDGEPLPANAVVFLSGADLVLDDVTATVDDVPVTVNLVPELSQGGTFGDVALRVDPAPQPGQTLVIEGTGCEPEWDCPVQTFAFEVVEPDEVAPPSLAELSFDVFDHGETTGDDCGGAPGDVSYWLHFDEGVADPEPVHTVHRVDVVPAEDPEAEPVLRRLVYGDEAGGERSLRMLMADSELGGASPAEAFCFRVTTTDASGNEAGESELICEPCHVREDPEATEPWSEPEWTDEDVYAEGPCASGEEDSESGDLVDSRGCACSSTGGPGAVGLGWLVLLVFWRRGSRAIR